MHHDRTEPPRDRWVLVPRRGCAGGGRARPIVELADAGRRPCGGDRPVRRPHRTGGRRRAGRLGREAHGAAGADPDPRPVPTLGLGDAPRAFSCDPKALELCLDGLANGHFDALANVWQKSAFKIPLEHCECPEHLANIDRAIAVADRLLDGAPERLRAIYVFGAEQPRRARAVIARSGRHPHRNAVLGRASTPEEQACIDNGEFPHTTKIGTA